MNTLDCGHEPSPHNECTTGTARTGDGWEICWQCCAFGDLGRMVKNGNTRTMPAYLVRKDSGEWRVENWPGTLSFHVFYKQKGRHNLARTREDVWFVGPDLHVWHGVQYGEWTQIVHCRRTAEVWKPARELGYTRNIALLGSQA